MSIENSEIVIHLLKDHYEPESPIQTKTFNQTSFFSGPIKNISLLAIAWALTLCTSTLLTTIGPLSAQSLGASDSLSAFTVGVFLMGAAVSSVPSAQLFSKYGRLFGFSCGCLAQFLGSICGAIAMLFGNLGFIFLGCFFIGLGQGLGQFYRFSAVEVSPPEFKNRAITYVLSGGIFAAFLGPLSASNTADLEKHTYLASYLIVAVIAILNELTIWFVDFPKPNALLLEQTRRFSIDSHEKLKYRSVKEIIFQPAFIISCTVATLGHTIMVMLMSIVTLAMASDGYSLNSTSLVMELHFFAMFGPGFFTGKLISQYGSFVVALWGGVIFIGSIIIFILGTQSWNYFLGMILLGIGWNFSFSAGTVMLTETYQVH